MVKKRYATCPSCKETGYFEKLGEQTWPAEIARKLGMPEVIALWSCPHCSTTISDPDLLPPHTETDTEPINIKTRI